MTKATWLLCLAVPVCLAIGVGVGRVFFPEEGPARGPDAAAARLAELEAENEQLQRELEAARLEVDSLRAGNAAKERPESAAPNPLAEPADDGTAEPEAESESERVRKAREALPGLEYLLSANPTDRDLLAEYVNTAARAGEYDQAIAKLEALLAENPDSPDLMAQLGRAYLMKTRIVPNLMEQGQLAFGALKRFDAALEKDPEHYDSRFLRAVTNYNMPPFMNKMDSVIKDFETLLEQSRRKGDDEHAADSFAWLARSCQKAGKTEEAEGYLKKGLELYPGSESLERVKEQFEQSK